MKYKVLASAAHNFGHSFISGLNSSAMSEIAWAVDRTGKERLEIDLLTGHARPRELTPEPVLEAIARYHKEAGSVQGSRARLARGFRGFAHLETSAAIGRGGRVRTVITGLVLFLSACGPRPELADPVLPEGPLRIVRFHVKAGGEAEFERFFTESLVPAAEKLSESPEAFERALDRFELLRPMNRTSGVPSTYYVLFRGMRGDENGEMMRDLVRRAFPPAEAQERVQRWMRTIDLESLVPRGEDFERVVLHPASRQ